MTSQPANQIPSLQRYILAATLFSSYMLFAFGWRAGDAFVASLGFTAGQTALMTNALTLAQMVGSLVAANLLLKMGVHKAFVFGSLLIISGGLVSLTTSFPLVFFIRFVLGIGGSLVVVLMSGIVAQVFTGRELQIVNGVNSVAFNTGLAFALTFWVPLSANPVAAVLIAAGLSTVVLVVWLLISRVLPRAEANQQAADSSYTMKHGFGEWFNWVFALAYTGLLSYYIVAFTFMDFTTVRWVVYAGVVGALTGTVVAARTPDYLKPRIVVWAAALQIVSAAAVLAFAESSLITLVGIILGLAIFFPMPFFVQLAFIRPGATPRKISVTFSIFWAVSYGGSIIFIQIFGWITDATGGLEGGVPVSTVPLMYIVLVEAGFLVGSILLARHLKPHLDSTRDKQKEAIAS